MSTIENFLEARFEKFQFDYSSLQIREIALRMRRSIEVGLGKRAAKKGEKGLAMIDTRLVRPEPLPRSSSKILGVEIGGRKLRVAVGSILDGTVTLDYFDLREAPKGLSTSPLEVSEIIKPVVAKYNLKVGAISLAVAQKVVTDPESGGLIDGVPLGSGSFKGARLKSSKEPYGFAVKKALGIGDFKFTVGNDVAFGAAGNWLYGDVAFEIKGTGTNYFIRGYNTEAGAFSAFPPQPLDWIPKGLKKDPYLLEQYTAGRGFEQSLIKIARELLFKNTPQRLATTFYTLLPEISLDREKRPVTAGEIFEYFIHDNERFNYLVAQKRGLGGFLDVDELRGLKLIARKIFTRACIVNGLMWEALFEVFEMGESKQTEVYIACDGSLISNQKRYRDETIRYIKETAQIFGRERYAQYVMNEKRLDLSKVTGVSKDDVSWGLMGAFVLGAISVHSCTRITSMNTLLSRTFLIAILIW